MDNLVSWLGDGRCTVPGCVQPKTESWGNLESRPRGFWFGNCVDIKGQWVGLEYCPLKKLTPRSFDIPKVGTTRDDISSVFGVGWWGVGTFLNRCEWEWGRGIAGISRQWALAADNPLQQKDRRQKGQVDAPTDFVR